MEREREEEKEEGGRHDELARKELWAGRKGSKNAVERVSPGGER